MTEPREPESYPANTEPTPAQPTPAAEPTAARFASEEPSQAEAWTELPRLAAPATGPEPAADLPSWATPPATPAPTLPAAPAWTAPAAPPAPVLPPVPAWGAPPVESATSGWVAPPAAEPTPEPPAAEPVVTEPPAVTGWSAPVEAPPVTPAPASAVPAPPAYAEPEPVAQWGSAPTPAEEPASPWFAMSSPVAEPVEVVAPAAEPAEAVVPVAEAVTQVADPVVPVAEPVVTPAWTQPSPVAEPVAPVAEHIEVPDALEDVEEPAEAPAAVWTPTGPVAFAQAGLESTPVSVATPNLVPPAQASPSPVTAPSPVASVAPVAASDDIFRTEESLAATQEPSEEELKLAAERAARREAREAALVAPVAAAPAAAAVAAPIRVEKRTNDKFFGSLGLFLLRLIVAAIFAIRGLGILTDLPAATKTFAATVLPQPELWAIITGASSLAIALALVLGLLTRVAGFGIAAIAGGALALVYWGPSFSPFVAGQPGFYGELELLLVGVGLVFLTIGAGGWSLDRSFRDARGRDQADEED